MSQRRLGWSVRALLLLSACLPGLPTRLPQNVLDPTPELRGAYGGGERRLHGADGRVHQQLVHRE